MLAAILLKLTLLSRAARIAGKIESRLCKRLERHNREYPADQEFVGTIVFRRVARSFCHRSRLPPARIGQYPHTLPRLSPFDVSLYYQMRGNPSHIVYRTLQASNGGQLCSSSPHKHGPTQKCSCRLAGAGHSRPSARAESNHLFRLSTICYRSY